VILVIIYSCYKNSASDKQLFLLVPGCINIIQVM